MAISAFGAIVALYVLPHPCIFKHKLWHGEGLCGPFLAD